jgi:leucyl aminopeptidase (aminopeptidase T)
MKQKLSRAADNVIRNCLQVKPKEQVLVVTDAPCREIGQLLWEAAGRVGDPVLVEILPRRMHGEEPPEAVARMLRECDVFIMPTSMSLSHTQARKEASRLGKRGATLPGITRDTMARTLNADYHKIEKLSERLARRLTQAKTACITTRKGTNLCLSLAGRRGHPDTGIIHQPGDFSNLPGGEAYIAPVEGTGRGQVVIDGSMASMGALKKDLIIVIERGRITAVANDHGRFARILAEYGPKAHNVAELGIGTNSYARITGEVLEDEKVLGTVHVAFGNNFAFGGKVRVPVHLDGIIKEPTLYLDGRLVMKDGRLTT